MTSMKKLLVTGSSGLIGSEVSTISPPEGWKVHGLDNNHGQFSLDRRVTLDGTSSDLRRDRGI